MTPLIGVRPLIKADREVLRTMSEKQHLDYIGLADKDDWQSHSLVPPQPEGIIQADRDEYVLTDSESQKVVGYLQVQIVQASRRPTRLAPEEGSPIRNPSASPQRLAEIGLFFERPRSEEGSYQESYEQNRNRFREVLPAFMGAFAKTHAVKAFAVILSPFDVPNIGLLSSIGFSYVEDFQLKNPGPIFQEQQYKIP